jgi:hypothetical protein
MAPGNAWRVLLSDSKVKNAAATASRKVAERSKKFVATSEAAQRLACQWLEGYCRSLYRNRV